MKYFKLILIFLCSIFLISGITYNENYINKAIFIGPGYNQTNFIEQKAGYNFIVTDISIVTDCQSSACNYIDVDINDNTGAIDILKFKYFSDPNIKNENINKQPILIKGIMNINNNSLDAGIYINIAGYYLDNEDNFFTQLQNELLNKSLNNVISLILLYLIHIYLFFFFAKSGFKLGKEYFFKKRKNEND